MFNVIIGYDQELPVSSMKRACRYRHQNRKILEETELEIPGLVLYNESQ